MSYVILCLLKCACPDGSSSYSAGLSQRKVTAEISLVVEGFVIVIGCRTRVDSTTNEYLCQIRVIITGERNDDHVAFYRVS